MRFEVISENMSDYEISYHALFSAMKNLNRMNCRFPGSASAAASDQGVSQKDRCSNTMKLNSNSRFHIVSIMGSEMRRFYV